MAEVEVELGAILKVRLLKREPEICRDGTNRLAGDIKMQLYTDLDKSISVLKETDLLLVRRGIFVFLVLVPALLLVSLSKVAD